MGVSLLCYTRQQLAPVMVGIVIEGYGRFREWTLSEVWHCGLSPLLILSLRKEIQDYVVLEVPIRPNLIGIIDISIIDFMVCHTTT
jgi:hypothetical protein